MGKSKAKTIDVSLTSAESLLLMRGLADSLVETTANLGSNLVYCYTPGELAASIRDQATRLTNMADAYAEMVKPEGEKTARR